LPAVRKKVPRGSRGRKVETRKERKKEGGGKKSGSKDVQGAGKKGCGSSRGVSQKGFFFVGVGVKSNAM